MYALIRSLAGLSVGAMLFWGPARADAPLKAEVIHWWTSGGEAAAVKVFADAYDKSGGQWIDSAIAGGGGEAARTAGQLAGGTRSCRRRLSMRQSETATTMRCR